MQEKNLIYRLLHCIRAEINTGLYPACKRETMKDTLILAVETSGRHGSIALGSGARLLEEQPFSAPMKDSAEIFPAACALLERHHHRVSEIKHIYISSGPGSFTGIRIAITMAKAAALAAGTKIVAVDSLEVIAGNINPASKGGDTAIPTAIAPVIDAKRGKFFTAVYIRIDEQWQKASESCILSPEELIQQYASADRPLHLLGEGLLYYRDRFRCPHITIAEEELWSPRASRVHQLGWKKALRGGFTDRRELKPVYLRDPDVNQPKKQN